MCGIAGLVNHISAQFSEALVQQMLELVAHRGPDGQGIHSDGPVTLGHRRLSIVDLSDAAAQPMTIRDGDLVITFNGEIYNHIEIRSELELKGCLFNSHSDTEVILQAFSVWGDACVSRFNGMWAFAIWDRRRRRLFCSRDRFGVKPFYYLAQGAQLAFGSEIRQLLSLQDERRGIRHKIEEFLLTGMTDHTDFTFFAGIRKLPAGHNMVWSESDPTVKIHRYFRLEQDIAVKQLTTEEAVQKYTYLLQDAVRLRLRSDVTVGTCLSGGLDSSAVASLAAQMYSENSGQRFSAITAISEQEDNNEEVWAAQVAEMANLNWLTVQPVYADLRSQLDSVVLAQEEPFGSASIVMQYAVMRKARKEGIPVMLDGQGGDETLLGYKKYVAAYAASQWRSEGAPGFLKAIRSANKNNAHWSLIRIMMYIAGSRLAGWRYRLNRWEHRYLKGTPALPEHLSAYADVCFDDFHLQRLEIEKTNLPALLRYEDKNSMAHSIEARLPFLDYRLVEFSLSLPGNLKIRDGWSKWILRQSAASILPASVAWRRTKYGFEAPERLWQRALSGHMKAAIQRSCLLNELIDPRRLDASFDRLPLRSQWRLYSVALWAEAFGVRDMA